jgi:hypothetical protein
MLVAKTPARPGGRVSGGTTGACTSFSPLGDQMLEPPL